MSPLRQCMIDGMKWSNCRLRRIPSTSVPYETLPLIIAARQTSFARGKVRAYLLAMRERGAARGTFKANHYGTQFLSAVRSIAPGTVLKKKTRQRKQKRLPNAARSA
jgi:hypothetical protein